MVELQSEDEKKAEVVGKVDNNEEQANKEQTKNKNIILNKDENIEKNKSEGEAKGEDEQYGKPNQHQREKKSWEIKHQQEKNIKIKIPAKQTRNNTFQITSRNFSGQKKQNQN